MQEVATADGLKPENAVHGHAEGGVPAYHLFEKFGEYFVYDTSACRFFHVDSLTYKFLDICRENAISEARRVLSDDGRYAVEAVESRVTEFQLLTARGLFRHAGNTVGSPQVSELLAHRQTAPLTKLELALAEACNLACKYC